MNDKDVKREFELYLDDAWPLWRQHVGTTRYLDLQSAFTAGVVIGEEGPTPEAAHAQT